MPPVLKGILIGLVALAAVLLVLYVTTVIRSGSTAPPRTSVEGVDISGLSPEAAAAAVTAKYEPVARKRLKVVSDGKTYVVKPLQAGITVDAAASVAPAYGRTWNPATLISHLFGARSLPVVVAVDKTALATQVQSIADAVDQPPVNPELTVSNGT